jgi:transcriptional regulator with XRE-family HTH domain
MPDTKKDEVQAFTVRLESLLLKKGSTLSPTALARDFNLRWRGVPVTVNATRKWLMGQAMPTMDKLAVLANLLNTSQDWLRFGDLSLENSDTRSYASPLGITQRLARDDEKSFAQDFKLLNASNKRVMAAMMEVLLKEQQPPYSNENDLSLSKKKYADGDSIKF